MLVNGVFKLLSIEREGKVKESGDRYMHINSLDFRSGEYVMLHAFGNTADYIKRNFTTNRRAMVSGELVINRYQEDADLIKNIRVKGEKVKVKLKVAENKFGLSMTVHHVHFIDKKRTDGEDVEVWDEDEEIEIIEAEDLEEDEVEDDNETPFEVEGEVEEEEEEKPKKKTTKKATKTTKKTTKKSDPVEVNDVDDEDEEDEDLEVVHRPKRRSGRK